MVRTQPSKSIHLHSPSSRRRVAGSLDLCPGGAYYLVEETATNLFSKCVEVNLLGIYVNDGISARNSAFPSKRSTTISFFLFLLSAKLGHAFPYTWGFLFSSEAPSPSAMQLLVCLVVGC